MSRNFGTFVKALQSILTVLLRFSPRNSAFGLWLELLQIRKPQLPSSLARPVSALSGLKLIYHQRSGSSDQLATKPAVHYFQRPFARSVSRDTEALPEIERYTFSFGSMKVRQIVGKALISSSFEARRSLRNQITFSFRSALASSGRARKPSEKRVVIMQTATLSTTSHTRSIGDCFVTGQGSLRG